MFKKFLNGLVFGSGFAIAFVAIWAIGLSYVIPMVIENTSNKEPDMSGSKIESVVPLAKDTTKKREYKLHKGAEYERKIPMNGGMLSIAIFDEDSGKDRPNSFQAWVTKNEAFIVSTEGDIPTIKRVPYKTTIPVDFASNLVHDNVGFHKQNSTMTISEIEIKRLKDGRPSSREGYLNGELRMTENGVVFLMPNKYEHNKSLQPTAENGG
ncbi:hypothetical protein [Shewanella marina]|uniref:hypothetical protein n=1 Tax=Shewanella marina TaxID=487319 RepID=UPI0004724F4B|nr:hypothetical protein [Shewanella marina]